MKKLYLLRHAKSSWATAGIKDIDRPLNDRGLRDAPLMAQRLLDSGASIDLIISSPALRTRSTAEIFCKVLGLGPDRLSYEPRIYLAGTGRLLQIIQQLDESAAAVLIVGHNPTLTDFVNEMSNAGIENIPTCGLATLSLPIEYWALADFGQGTLTAFDVPKDHLADVQADV